MKTSTPYRRPLTMAKSGRIESVIGGTSVGVETMKVAWFQVAASILAEHSPMALKRLQMSESLLIASYVLTELAKVPDWWLKFEALAIIEPSTSGDSRSLMATRQSLIENGYHVWAPCTHQGLCPQLTHSERDWCHDRIHWQQPQWFTELEKHLPMKNRTLTFSYLLARRSLPPPKALSELSRLTGDMLEEKGKTRQSLCRGPEREFLAWFPQRLPKGEEISLQRGGLVRLPSDVTHKASELRFSSKAALIEIPPDEPIGESAYGSS